MRNYLLFTALLVSALVSAQVTMRPVKSSVAISAKTEKTAKITSVTMDKNVVVTTIESLKSVKLNPRAVTRAGELTEAAYDKPYGAYYFGIDAEGWYSFPYIEVAPFVDLLFWPWADVQEGTTYSWTINRGEEDIPLEQDAEGVATCKVFGLAFTPILTAKNGAATVTYQMAEATVDGNLGFLENQSSFVPMSMTDPSYGEKNNVYGGVGDSFYFGSGYTSDGKNTIGVLTVFDQPMSPLYVKNIVANAIKVNEEQDLIPAGKTLTLSLYKIDSEGKPTQELLASATATADNVEEIPGSGIYNIAFDFKTMEDGFEVIQPITLGDCAFLTQITGVDGVNANFLLGSNKGWAGSSYNILSDGSLNTLTFNDGMIPAYGIHLNMNAFFPNLLIYDENNTVIISKDGGIGVAGVDTDGNPYTAVNLYTNLPLQDEDGEDNIWVEAPDWLKIAVDESAFEDYGVILYTISTDEANESRAANVIFHTHAGVSAKVQVIQGTPPVGISSTSASKVKVISTADAFELSYPSDVTSATLFNISGQTVASYQLPESGTFTMPASALNKGVYVIKFMGNAVSSVKVVR